MCERNNLLLKKVIEIILSSYIIRIYKLKRCVLFTINIMYREYNFESKDKVLNSIIYFKYFKDKSD